MVRTYARIAGRQRGREGAFALEGEAPPEGVGEEGGGAEGGGEEAWEPPGDDWFGEEACDAPDQFPPDEPEVLCCRPGEGPSPCAECVDVAFALLCASTW